MSEASTRRPTGAKATGRVMTRPAEPEELSPSYVFPASPVCSGYTTGIVLPVTGSVGAI